jgi:hypothetical protein
VSIHYYCCARSPVARVAIFVTGGLTLSAAVVLSMFLSREKRPARSDVDEVAALSSLHPTLWPGSALSVQQVEKPIVGKTSTRHGQQTKVKTTAPTEHPKVIVKRRVDRTEEELIAQIKLAPEVALDHSDKRVESRAVMAVAREALDRVGITNDATLALFDRRPDLAGLPLRRGQTCRLPESTAVHFDQYAQTLRGQASNPMWLRKMLVDDSKEKKWLKNESVPVLMQILMAESCAIREILAEHLARILGRPATEALAQLALFDLHPQVRARAIAGLADRPAEDFRQVLLDGFEHPWPAVADHAAEAIVALQMKDTVPDLARLLTIRDPGAPYTKPGSDQRFVKELVRVNHLQNCLLCHPPSFRTEDRVRGLARPDEQERKSVEAPVYYKVSPKSKKPLSGIFVHADVTYLKQDFSRMLPVADPGKGPAVQRFDFFVRERLATERDRMKSGAVERLAYSNLGFPARQYAVVFALRELTGRDPGPSVADWKALVSAYRLGE